MIRRPRVSTTLTAGWLVVGSAAYASLLVVLRGRPSVDLDAGVFLSVAGRLLHGAHLYSGVWDNKDPLFFYGDAAALWVAGWKGPFLLDILWVAVAAASIAALLDALGAPTIAKAAGFVAYPLLLTGQWYFAGYSMLAALALAPLGAWLWARGNPLVAGVVVGLGVLFKINLALVLVAAPFAMLVTGIPARRDLRGAVRFVAGLGGVLAFAAGLLAVRGELHPYLDMLRGNVSYANQVLVANGRLGGIHGHVRVVEAATRHAHLVIALFVIAVALAVWAGVARRPATSSLRATAALFLAVVTAAAVTLGTTAAWDHHVQMLAYPGVLLVLLALTALDGIVHKALPRWGAQVVAGLGAVLVLGGAQSGAAGGAPSTWFHGAHSRTAIALEVARADHLAGASHVSYTHLGQNDEEAQGAFIGGGWTLACAHFHEYPWTPPATLSSILHCVETKRPQLLLITSSLSDRPGAPVAWHRFVVAAESLVRKSYTRVYFLRHAHGTVAVWKLR